MNYVIELPESNKYNAILIIINKLIKKRYYVSYIAIEKDISIEITVEMLIREVF